MMDYYNQKFHYEILERLKKINVSADRIKFLYDEKSNFIAKNKGSDASQIILMFDNLIDKEKLLYELDKATNQEIETVIDYSENSKTEKIVFLYELGILDYLKDKMKKELNYFAPNKLAEIVSTFTGISQVTAQSYLNPIFSKDVDQQKNPLTKDNLKKVRTKLSNIGFDIQKTT